MTADAFLTLRRAAVGYDGRPILRDIELDLTRGTFTALLGPNGSGKTTLLRTFLGLLPLLEGEMRLAAGTDGARPVIGYVPQRETLDPIFLFSCHEVVLMGACGRVGPGRFYPRAEKAWTLECLRQVGADTLAPCRFSELSGGQRQRVLLARALATRPGFLVLDEPTTGLDAAATHELMDLLEDIHARTALTILMVCHDLPLVRTHIHEVIWIHEGRLWHGPTADLLTREKVEEILKLEVS